MCPPTRVLHLGRLVVLRAEGLQAILVDPRTTQSAENDVVVLFVVL